MKLPAMLRSQKFVGLVLTTLLVLVAGIVLQLDKVATVVMAIAGLYATFVTGRSFTDSQAIKAQPKAKADKEVD
jgi:hypothetical protein